MKRAGEGAQLSVPELPANPRVLSQLLSTLGESGATSSSLGRVILTDPALTLAVLRAVLAGTGFPDPSRGFSMEACVDALGRDLLQAYTLLRATRQVAAGLTDTTPGPLTQTWRHSLVCAHAAAALARAASKPEQECHLAGLLCDIGTLARQGTGASAPVRAPAPHEWSWADSEATVMVLAETDGGWIGRGWLPPFVADALRLRKESAEVLADAPFVVRALKVALALADGGASETARKLGRDLLGLDEQDITRAAETAVAAARDWSRTTSSCWATSSATRTGSARSILNEELDRIGRIVQRMGAPFTVETGEAARVDLNATVKEVMTLASETLTAGRGIEVQQQLDPRIPVLQGDAVGLKQVVLNLLTNAVEAMPDGGRLTIVTADNVNLSGEPFVLLQVTDTGKGMAPESMRRLFQAGFSTKGEGHEGIGLSVSESIVRGMGGRILCRSHEGRGTIFVVLLPRRAAGESGAGSAPAPG